MNTLLVKSKWAEGRPVFEVPVMDINHNGGKGPRCPVGGYTAYYTPDTNRCVIVVSKTAGAYLSQRSYARYVGVAKYDPRKGIGQFEWQPAEKPEFPHGEFDNGYHWQGN